MSCLIASIFQLLLRLLEQQVTPCAGANEQLTGRIQLPEGLSAWAFAS